MAPNQWLLELEAHHDGYRTLLDQTGSLAIAAHRLAEAWCRVRPVSSRVPTRSEVEAAAKRIAARAGLGERVPDGALLAMDCEAKGLLVL